MSTIRKHFVHWMSSGIFFGIIAASTVCAAPASGGPATQQIPPAQSYATITGTVSYSGTMPAYTTVYVFVSTSENISSSMISSTTIAAPGAFTVNALAGSPRWIAAYMDANNNHQYDQGEPDTQVGPVTLASGTTTWLLTLQIDTAEISPGEGTCSVSPIACVVGDSTTLRFVYTVPSGKYIASGGGVRITIPSTWSTPQNMYPTMAGYVVASTTKGVSVSVGVGGSTITATVGGDMYATEQIYIVYGSSASYESGKAVLAALPSGTTASFNVASAANGSGTFGSLGTQPTFTLTDNTQATVTGIITYSGSYGSTITYVSAYSQAPTTATLITNAQYSTTTSGSSYELSVGTGTNWYMAAYKHSGGGTLLAYSTMTYRTGVLSSASSTTVNISMSDPVQRIPKFAGTISYSGTATGTHNIYIQYWNQPTFTTGSPVSTTTIASVYIYSLLSRSYESAELTAYTTYYLRGWIDTNDNMTFDATDPYYTSSAVRMYNDEVVHNIPLQDPGQSNPTISGTVSYSGTQVSSGTVKNIVIEFLTGTTHATATVVSSITLQNVTISASLQQSYQSNALTPNTSYYVRAWIDTTGNGIFSSSKPHTEYNAATLVTNSGVQGYALNIQDGSSSQTSSVTGYVYYADGATLATAEGEIEVSLNSTNEWFSIQYSTRLPVVVGQTTYTFTIADVPISRSFYVFAFKKIESATRKEIQQSGKYTYNPLYLSTTTAYNVGTIALEAMGGMVTGKITYSQPIQGRVYVLVMSTPNVDGMFERRLDLYKSGSSTTTMEYQFMGLPSGTTYYIGAYIDINWNSMHDPQEPKGYYATSIVTGRDALSDIDITLTQPTGDGTLQGSVYYTGTTTGTVKVQYWYNVDTSQTPTGIVTAQASQTSTTTWTYSITGLLAGQYNLRAFVDTNGSSAYDATEAHGARQWVYFSGGVLAGNDITMSDPQAMELRGYVVFSSMTSTASSSYGMNQSTFSADAACAGAIVQLWDTLGTNDCLDDVLIASATSTDTLLTTTTQRGTYQHNFAFTNVSIIAQRDYRVKAYKQGWIVEPQYDLMMRVQDTSQSIQYLGQMAWVNGFKLSPRPTYAVTNVKVSNGVETSTSNVTITPNNDGNRENATIEFTYTIPSDAQSYYGAHYRLIVDTNRDGQFTWFDWSQVRNDERGNPIYQGTTRTWDELNRIIAENSDWMRDGWLDQSKRTGTERVMWEGRTPNWTAVAQGTYPVELILIDTPWWDENNYANHIVHQDSTTLTVTVDVAGISGAVYYRVADSTVPVAVSGARVDAGGERGWGQAYTCNTGTFTINALTPGRYWVNVTAKGFSAASQEVIMPSTGATNVILYVDKGGALRGKVKLSKVFTPYRDKWGGYQQQLWGNVNAWSTTSANRGWAEFKICEGTDTADYEMTLPPGTYQVKAQAPDYGSTTETIVVTSTGTADRTFNLTKAASINGTIKLPLGDTASKNLWLNVGAQSANSSVFGSGGGQMLQGATTAAFTVREILPGTTYQLRINLEGYADKIVTGIVLGSTETDKNIGEISMTSGGVIEGILTINGDTSRMNTSVRNPGDPHMAQVWVNAHCPQLGFGRGAEVRFTTSTTQSTGTFRIAGLSAGTYQLDMWLDGFELQDMPIRVILATDGATATQNLTLEKFSGNIAGTVLGTGIDYSKVYVTAKLPWWQNATDPGKGGAQYELITSSVSAAGTFTMTGLGTGEYILTANEYTTPPSGWTPGRPTGNFGEVIERVGTGNGLTSSVTLEFSSGSAIVCTLDASNVLIAGTTQAFDFQTCSATIRVRATPMKMQWFNDQGGGKSPQWVYVGHSSAAFIVPGLASDVYSLYVDGDVNGDNRKEVADVRETVFVSGGETKSIAVTMRTGYMITGTVERPQTGQEFFWVGLFKAETNSYDTIANTNVEFRNQPNSQGYVEQDYESQRTKAFSLGPVIPGKYALRVNSPNYKDSFYLVEITSTDISLPNITVEKGGYITGTLVDGVTGEAVSASAVTVIAQATPWVEGGYRQTNNNDTGSSSTISSGTFRLANLPEGTYTVIVGNTDSSEGSKASSSAAEKKYASIKYAGVYVPDEVKEVTLGTIKLYEGVTISGRVTRLVSGSTTTYEGAPNIRVAARPSASHEDKQGLSTKTDAQGYYKIEGVNADIKYWEVTAAQRPYWKEQVRIEYGEETKDNVAPRATNVDFRLTRATARLTGRVLAPQGVDLEFPMGETGRGAYVILSKKGKVYTDPIGGIQEATAPEGTFNIQGLVTGEYNVKVMAKNLATFSTTTILVDGANTLPDVTLNQGGSVQGIIRDTNGKKISTSYVESVLVIEKERFILTFGNVSADPSTREILTYEVRGLKPGTSYYIAMAGPNGTNIVMSSYTVCISSNSEVLTRNLIYADAAPTFMVQVARDARDDKKFLIAAFISKPLTETTGSDVISVSQGSGVIISTSIVYATSKDSIRAEYYCGATDTETFKIRLTGHDLTGQSTTKEFQIRVGMRAKNEEFVNPSMGGSVKLGEGDLTQLYLPSGALDSTSTVRSMIVKIDSTEIVPSSVSLPSPVHMLKRSSGAYPFRVPLAMTMDEISQAGGMLRVAAMRRPGSTSNENTLHSGYYNIAVNTNTAASVVEALMSASLSLNTAARVTIQYDTTTVTAAMLADMDIEYYDTDAAVWRRITTNRTIDTTNGTIAIDVDHLTTFAVFVDTTAPATPVNLSTATTGSTTSVQLTWNAVTSTDLNGYHVYRSTVSASQYVVCLATVAKTVTQYTDTGLNDSTTYYYMVSAFDDASNRHESAQSSAVNWHAPTTGPSYYTGKFITYVYPSPYNPANGVATFRYKIPGTGQTIKVSLKIYTITGELVRTLIDDESKTDGDDTYQTTWNGKNDSGENVASGVYIYVLKAGNHKEIKKFAVIR